jgi:acetylornithine deacetylase/succinyl-diaminopimelate desuccinylase-like protein
LERKSLIKEKASSYIKNNLSRYIDLLRELVSIPSVSAYAKDEMRKCSEYISDVLREKGFKTEIVSGGGHPAVLAEIGRGSRTILIYNHYDVQPPDPLDQWSSNPFQLDIRGEHLVGRGVADNKGNIVARIAAIDSIYEHIDELGLRIKMFIEGEEEIGSPTLEKIVEMRREWLKAEGGFWETGYLRRDGRLGISLGFKGMLYIELIIRGASRDVHSGNAPLIPNPVWRMARLLTYLKREDGSILVPGFYDDIDQDFIRESEEIIRELDYEELDTRPSLYVSGLYSGYTGRGSKTIVPSTAGVKIDIRPVPGQDPKKIFDKLKEYLERLGFTDIEYIIHSSYPAGYTKINEKIVRK